MTRELLPDELISSLLQQVVVLTLQSHGYTSAHPLALKLINERVEKRTFPYANSINVGIMSLLRRAALMANTQRRTIPSPIDLSYAFLMENVHTYDLEDEIHRWPFPPQLHPSKGNALFHTKFTLEPPHPALLPSPVNELVYTRAILPPALRPQTNTPSFIPSTFPKFPPKYTYSFTPSYPPRAVDPETIRRKVVEERALIESSLSKLVAGQVRPQAPIIAEEKQGRERREEIWWEVWREMGCDLERGNDGVWPVEKSRRGVNWAL